MLKAMFQAAFGKFFRKKYQFKIDRNRRRDFERIKKYAARFDDPAHTVDDRTWEDLDMDAVYARLDTTFTNPGEEVLYSLLRTPQADMSALKARGDSISFFQRHEDQKKDVQELLYRAGRDDLDITGVLTQELKPNPLMRAVSIGLPLSLLGSIFFTILAQNVIGLLAIFVLFFSSIFVHFGVDHEFHHQSDAALYLGKLVNISHKMVSFIEKDFREYASEIKAIYEKCRSIGKRVWLLTEVEGFDSLSDQINALLLAKERKFFRMLKDIERHKGELLRLYRIIGELDAFITVAAYREEAPRWCAPDIVNEKGVLECEDIYHPLLENPVSNSLTVAGKGVIITGSNMSGKSTFLRTVGINALFSQTLYTCLAMRFRTGAYLIVTSITIRDDVLQGKSYYLREAEAILRIIRASVRETMCLAIIDEMFRGTNAVDRIHASSEVLNYLAAQNALPLIATHDMALVPQLKGYERYYFTEEISEEGDLTYDYRIRKGIAPSKNAIKILERIGYPPEIITNINARTDQ